MSHRWSTTITRTYSPVLANRHRTVRPIRLLLNDDSTVLGERLRQFFLQLGCKNAE